MGVVDEVVELFLTGGVADERERPGSNAAVGRHAFDRFHVLEKNGSPYGGRVSGEDGRSETPSAESETPAKSAMVGARSTFDASVREMLPAGDLRPAVG